MAIKVEHCLALPGTCSPHIAQHYRQFQTTLFRPEKILLISVMMILPHLISIVREAWPTCIFRVPRAAPFWRGCQSRGEMWLSSHRGRMRLSPHRRVMWLSAHTGGMWLSPLKGGMRLSPHKCCVWLCCQVRRYTHNFSQSETKMYSNVQFIINTALLSFGPHVSSQSRLFVWILWKRLIDCHRPQARFHHFFPASWRQE